MTSNQAPETLLAEQAEALAAAGTGSSVAPQLPTPAPSRTPRRLRRLQLLAAVAVAVPAILAGWTLSELGNEVTEVPRVVAQYDRLGQAQQAAIEAGNHAALAAVATGADATAQRDAVKTELGRANALLVEAAAAGPVTDDSLKSAATALAGYGHGLGASTGTDGAAARTAFAAADARLDDVLAPLAAAQQQLLADPAADGWHPGSILLVVATVAALAALIWISWLLAVRSHRVLNLGVVGAAVAVAAILGITLSVQGAISQAAGTGRGEELGRVVNAASGSVELAKARRAQVNAVVRQQWDTTAKDAYSAAFAKVTAASQAEPSLPETKSLREGQSALAEKLAASDWTGAAKLLVPAESYLTQGATDYWDQARSTAATALQAATAATERVARLLPLQLGLIAILGVAGALLAVIGIGQRIKEFQ